MKSAFQGHRQRPEQAGAEWHNGANLEILLYADSLQRAAKLLIQRLDQGEDAKSAWDAAPIILLYRQALELRLKALAGEGTVFLKTPTDHNHAIQNALVTLAGTDRLPDHPGGWMETEIQM